MSRKNVIVLIALPLLLLSCKEELTVKRLSLDASEIQLQESHEAVLVATVEPEELSDRVTWRSMDENIATVDAGGRVKGLLGGRTFILATAGSFTRGCAVTVFAPVEGLTLSVSSLFLSVDESYTIDADIQPGRALNRKLTWTSSNPAVAVVSGGVVVAKSLGTTVITAVPDENPSLSASCEVEVGVPVTSVEVSPETGSVYVGESLQLSAVVSPSDASHPDIVWRSEDESIATVDASGTVTGKTARRVRIVAEAPFGGISASASVDVLTHVSGVTLDTHSVDLYSLESVQLVASVLPESAFNKSVTWQSGNPLVATVDASGTVVARSKGSTVVTVTTVEGGFTDRCTVNVISGTAAVTSLAFEKGVYTVTVGKTIEIIPVVMPLDAGDKTVSWGISDPAVASVSGEGIFTGLKAGSVTLTATSNNNPEAKATCTLKVVPFSGGAGEGYDDHDYNWED